MDERVRAQLRAWQSSGQTAEGVAYLRARLQQGDLDWGSVEAAAFLGEPAAAVLLGEDALAVRRPGQSSLKALIDGLGRLTDFDFEVELRLGLGLAHGIWHWDPFLRSEIPAALDLALAALDGDAEAARRLSELESTLHEDFHARFESELADRDLLSDLLALTAHRVGRGDPPLSLEPGELSQRLYQVGNRRFSQARRRDGVTRALLPWLCLREVEPRDVAPALAAARARRLAPEQPESLDPRRRPLSEDEGEAIRDFAFSRVQRRGLPWDPITYGWVIRAWLEARGWRAENRHSVLLAPSGRRRVRLFGTKIELEERSDAGWAIKPTLAGFTIWNRALGEPLRDLAAAQLGASGP